MAVSSRTRAAIDEKSRHFERCYEAADAKGLVEYYFVPDTAGPMASPPGGQPPVRGHAALIEMFTSMFAGVPHIRLETLELAGSDDTVFELGRAHLGLADGGKAKGRYTVCWQNIDGEWSAKIDFFAEDGWED